MYLVFGIQYLVILCLRNKYCKETCQSIDKISCILVSKVLVQQNTSWTPFDLSTGWNVLFIWNHKLYHPSLSMKVLWKHGCFILILFFSAHGINFHFSYLIFTVGRRRIQHWEGSPCSDTEAENHGVLWKEGETNWTAKENVSYLG